MSSSTNLESELQARLGAVANDNAAANITGAAIAASAAAAAADSAREQQQSAQQAQQAHAYSNIQTASASVDQTHIHPSLRAAAPATTLVPTANMMPAPAQAAPAEAPAPAAAPPAVAPSPVSTVLANANLAHVVPAPPASGADDSLSPSDGRKVAKRELSQSKRAAQNRAAQRAFRQRKEGYIKKLESQVKEYESMEKAYKTLQQENYQLRDYILGLQARLMDSQGDYPPPPATLNLQNPAHQPTLNNVPEPHNDASGTNLEAIAQAVAGVSEQAQQQQAQQPPAAQQQHQQMEDVKMEEEVARQLRSEDPRQT